MSIIKTEDVKIIHLFFDDDKFIFVPVKNIEFDVTDNENLIIQIDENLDYLIKKHTNKVMTDKVIINKNEYKRLKNSMEIIEELNNKLAKKLSDSFLTTEEETLYRKIELI